MKPPVQRIGNGGFSLIEVLTVVVVIGILAAMLTGVVSKIRFQAEKANCISNLKNLYAGTALYIQDQQQFPQVFIKGATEADKKAYAKGWIEALRPYGISEVNWRCTSVERILKGDPEYDPKEVRIDYLANPFDDKPTSPYQFPKQPWFVERGAVHEGGNLMIWTNGRILTLEEAVRNP